MTFFRSSFASPRFSFLACLPTGMAFCSFLYVFLFIFPLNFADAQTTVSTVIPSTVTTQAALQAELAQVEAEEAQAQVQLQSAQNQSASIQKDINVLTAQINAANLKIKQENLIIQTLGQNITQKQSNINMLGNQIDQGHQTLAEILVKINENGDITLANIILGSDSLSQAMASFDDFQSVQQALAVTFNQLRANEAENQSEKAQLTDKQNQEIDAKQVIQQQQATVQQAENQKKQLLAVSKENESAYSSLVVQNEQKAAQIRAALFNLAGTSAISFGNALNYANTVYTATGVPQAFLLAILTQETGIGKNDGTCYLTDTGDGSGVDSNGNRIANVMKPSRDIQPFLAITSSLGLDYKSMQVSCPQSIGYGGGMGPAQFIASTWALLVNRIKSALGISTAPNPWHPLDAFTASGLYLSDLGANSSSYTAQKNAACKYYSGHACGVVKGASAYGSSVMALANQIQTTEIDPLEGL
jgi:peptidoglycan hydrolase CwlO-like protein